MNPVLRKILDTKRSLYFARRSLRNRYGLFLDQCSGPFQKHQGPTANGSQKKVLLTGAAGRIGTSFRQYVGDRYDLRLADRRLNKLDDSGGHEVIRLEAADLKSCQKACQGVDTVIHLAGDPSPKADFYRSLLDNNIKGTYNIYRAAKDQGCRRVIFASSIRAVRGHSEDVQVHPDSPVRPIDMYGVSKCFGEAVAHYFAVSEGLSSIVIRIGSLEAEWIRRNPTASTLSAFISRRDMSHLLVQCVEAPNIQFAIVNGVSDNRFKRLDITSAKELLGYHPQDDAFQIFNLNTNLQ